jgi:hypothetical protein
MKQTAVEWYEIEINLLIEKYEAKEISQRDFITMKHNLFYKAKEIEKKQLIDFACKVYNENYTNDKSFKNVAEQYYNETFNK